MPGHSDKTILITASPEVPSCHATQETPLKNLQVDISNIRNEKATFSNAEIRMVTAVTADRRDEAAEDRQRTGRYLAVGVTLIMIFLAFYNTVLRHATVLAGLLAPAIIMLLYILWLLYFAKKRKSQPSDFMDFFTPKKEGIVVNHHWLKMG